MMTAQEYRRQLEQQLPTAKKPDPGSMLDVFLTMLTDQYQVFQQQLAELQAMVYPWLAPVNKPTPQDLDAAMDPRLYVDPLAPKQGWLTQARPPVDVRVSEVDAIKTRTIMGLREQLGMAHPENQLVDELKPAMDVFDGRSTK